MSGKVAMKRFIAYIEKPLLDQNQVTETLYEYEIMRNFLLVSAMLIQKILLLMLSIMIKNSTMIIPD